MVKNCFNLSDPQLLLLQATLQWTSLELYLCAYPYLLLFKIEVELINNIILVLDFSGGPVVKNLPANAGDIGSIPGPVRFHMLRLSLCSIATKPAL